MASPSKRVNNRRDARDAKLRRVREKRIRKDNTKKIAELNKIFNS